MVAWRAGRGSAGRPAVRLRRSVTGPRTGLAGRGRQARGAAWVQAGRRVPAGRGRADGVVRQPLGRGGQVPGVGDREKPADQHRAGRRRHRGPGPVPPGDAARPGDVAPPGQPAAPAGRAGSAPWSGRTRNSASARASPLSSLLAGTDVRAVSTWLTGCHRVRSPSGSWLPSSRASRDRSSLGRSGRLLFSRLGSRLVILPCETTRRPHPLQAPGCFTQGRGQVP